MTNNNEKKEHGDGSGDPPKLSVTSEAKRGTLIKVQVQIWRRSGDGLDPPKTQLRLLSTRDGLEYSTPQSAQGNKNHRWS